MWIAVVATLAALVLLALFVVPRGTNAEDGPLPTDVETQILLGERPEDVDSTRRALLDGPDDPNAADR